MAIVVIGGHSRNIGKTSVACALISALSHYRWTAIKISPSGDHLCTANSGPCDCVTADHAVAISEEHNPAASTDSSRYLAAGAVRSLWIRTPPDRLAEAMPRIRTEIARSENVLLESNSILGFLKPDFYASVLNPEVADFKPSALRYLDRANALLLLTGTSAHPAVPAHTWPGLSPKLFAQIPTFRISPPDYASPAFTDFLAKTLSHI